MIVPGDNEDRQKQDSYNGPTVRAPERAARRRRSWSPLPDYEASEAQHRQSLALDKKRAWHQTRVWRGVLFSLLAYALLTTVIGVPIIVTKLKDNDKDDSSSGSFPNLMTNQFSSSKTITFDDSMSCNQWDNSVFVSSSRPYKTTLQLQLPAAGDISIRSNATLDETLPSKITGNLTVSYDANLKGNNTHLSVVMQTSSRPLQRSTQVCFAETGPNRGLSIFLPSNLTGTESITLDIRLAFPRENSPIHNFNVYLPAFAQSFQDLRKVDLETVNIEGTIQPIEVTNMQAPRITIKSLLGDISGTFNASESLILDTIKGVINTSITLIKPSYRNTPTSLILDTGDSEINADISLLSFARPSNSPHFWGKVNTFNAPINININQEHSTPSTPLYFSIQDNLASPKVIMDQKFEGTFFAQTKMAAVSIRQGDENPKYDPTGANRERTLQIDDGSSPAIQSGWIGWGKEPTGRGQSHIEVTTSLSPVDLRFGPT